MRWRRLFAGVGLFGLVGVGVIGVGAVGFVGWLRTESGNRWLEETIEGAVTSTMAEGSFSIGSLRTDLVGQARIEDLRIDDANGTPLVRIREAHAAFDVFSLLTGPLQVRHLEGIGVDVVLDQGNERMRLAELFGPGDPTNTDPFQLPIDLDVRSLSVEGVTVRMDDTLDVVGGVVEGGLIARGPVFIGSDTTVCAHLIEPGPLPVCASGPFTFDGSQLVLPGVVVEGPGTSIAVEGVASLDHVALVLAVGSIDLEAIDPLANDVGLGGTFSGTLRLGGQAAALKASGELKGTGETRGMVLLEDGYWNTAETTEWGGTLTARDVDVEQIWSGTGRPVVLDGVAKLSASGLRYPDDLTLDVDYQGEALVEDRYTIEDGDFVGQLAGGVFTLRQGDFHGIAGPLNATGTIDLDRGPLDLDISGSLDGEELAELGIEGLGGSNQVNLTLTGDLKKEAGRFGVGGTVVFAPLIYTEDVRFERMEARVDGTVNGTDYDFSVDADGSEGLAYGVALGAVSARDLDVRGRSSGLAVKGPVVAEAIRYEDYGTFALAQGPVDVSLPTKGERMITADLALGAYDIQTFPGNAGALRVGLRGDQVRFDVSLDAWGREQLSTAGTYDLATGTLAAKRLAVAPTPRLAWTASQPVALRVIPGGVADADVHLTGLHGNLDLTGRLATQGDSDGAVKVQDFQLDALAELFPDSFGGLSGVLDLDATVRGPSDALTLEADTEVLGLWVEGSTRWLDVKGHVSGAEDLLTTDLLVGSAGEDLARVQGSIPVHLDAAAPGPRGDGPVDARIELFPGPVERLENITVAELGLPEGELSGVVDLDGTLADPGIRLTGVWEQPFGGWEEPGRAEVNLRREGPRLEASATLFEGLAERAVVQASGTTELGQVTRWLVEGEQAPDTSDLEMWLNDMAVTVLLSKAPASSLLAAAETRVPAKGDLSGSIMATGSPYTPQISGDLQWYRGELGGYALDVGSARVGPGAKGLDLDLNLVFAEGGHARVAGSVPLKVDLREDSATWADGDMAIELDVVDLPLGMLSLVDTGLSEATGSVNLQGTLGGTFDDPNGDLSGRVVDGALVYRDLGLKVSDLQGELVGKRRRLQLKGVTARTEPLYPISLLDESRKSRIRLAGSANLDGLALSELTARVNLDDAWVTGLPEAALRTDGEVLVSGTWPELRVQGDVELVNGRVRYDPLAFAGAGTLATDRRMVIHREGVVQTEVEEVPSMLETMDIGLDIDLNRNLEVVGSYPLFEDLGSLTANLTKATLTARLGGEVHVDVDGGEPRVGGEVDVVSGDATLLQTEFSLDEGTVYFLGGDLGETQFEINGSSNVGSTQIDLAVRGTLNKPEIDVTSPGYDESQVLVMLLTNRSPESLATDEGAQAAKEARELGTAAAVLLASSVLTGTASGALAIDADGSVRVGAPWSSTVFAQLVLNAFADADENVLSFSLDWTLVPHVVLELGLGERYQWTELTWETRF